MARTANRYKDAAQGLGKKDKQNYQVGVYSRLSVDHHDRKSESVENQIEMIHQFIADNNADPDREMNMTVYDIYTDRGISGTAFDRRGFVRLMQDVREHRVNCIIVKDLSRFGRDYLETGGLIEQILPFLGCRFIAIADHFDSMAADANEGRLVMNLKNLVNDMYAKDISNRVTAARRMSAQRGSFTGSFAPYGYDVVRVQGIRKLQMNEECAKVVRKIFTLYAQGAAVKEIITRLYAEQVHRISDYKKYGHVYCRNGEELHQWSEGAISGMLQNRSYLGSLHRDISYVKQREQITEGNTHEAIISRELFELVQERSPGSRQVRKKSYRQRSTENVYRHILYCGCCGKAMRAAYHQSRIKDERHYAYYCRRTYLVDGRKCEKNYITEEKLTELCLEQIRSMFSGQQVKAGDLTGLNQAEYDRKMAEYMLEERKIADECERLKKHAGILYGQYKAGMIARDEYELFRRRKRRQEELAEKSLEEIRQKRRQAGSSVQEEKDFLCSLLKGDTGIKPDILFIEAMHEKISIFPDGVVDITYRFQGEDRV